ncbi:MAG: hypothetical protein KBB21_29745 [Nannocystaceae bacterium]|nr:hypothetical protein [Deltaproteobacteria bacterium]MBK8720541.1 hypothetical protein [Deltaproteobacteria bacterium]MBP7290846.1 hypothetical protein [Nannocystaceae bacterium]
MLARISLFSRSEEDLGDELPRLVARLEEVVERSLMPAMFGVLDDDDPHGALWSVFYLLEGLDDDYLDGLLDALPGLLQHAPGWAQTAILRIVNTAGEPEDCTNTLIALARRRRAATRKQLAATFAGLGKHGEGLHATQRRTLARIADAITA